MNMHKRMMLLLVIVLDRMNFWGRYAFFMMDDKVKIAFKDLNALQ
jgi:hypothetical protein